MYFMSERLHIACEVNQNDYLLIHFDERRRGEVFGQDSHKKGRNQSGGKRRGKRTRKKRFYTHHLSFSPMMSCVINYHENWLRITSLLVGLAITRVFHTYFSDGSAHFDWWKLIKACGCYCISQISQTLLLKLPFLNHLCILESNGQLLQKEKNHTQPGYALDIMNIPLL